LNRERDYVGIIVGVFVVCLRLLERA